MPLLMLGERRRPGLTLAMAVASVAVGACTPARPVPASTAPPTATPAGSASARDIAAPGDAGEAPPSAAASATPPFAVPPSLPFPTARLTIEVGEPFTARTLRPPRRLGRGNVVLPLLEGPDRAAVALAGGRGALLDTTSGRVLVTTPATPEVVAPRAGAVVLKGRPLRILRTERLDVIEPRLDAGGRTLKFAELVAMPRRSAVLAIAEASDGAKLMGRLSPDLARVALGPTELRAEDDNVYTFERSPLDAFELVANTRKTAALAGTPFSLPHESGCVRLRVDDDGRATCLDYRPMNEQGGQGVVLLGGGWFVGYEPARGWDGAFISHTSWGERRLGEAELHPGNMCQVQQTFTSPPRVVFTCRKPASVVMWSPQAIYTAALPDGAPGGASIPDGGTLLPLFPWRGVPADDVATRWVDPLRGRLLETPPLKPLAWAAESGVLDRSLATDERGAVWLVDAARGARARVEDTTGCSGSLKEELPEGADPTRFRALACYAPPAKGHIESQILWSLALDLQRRTMYKTPLRIVAWHQDGTFLLSTTTNIEAETPAAPGELSAVNLVEQI